MWRLRGWFGRLSWRGEDGLFVVSGGLFEGCDVVVLEGWSWVFVVWFLDVCGIDGEDGIIVVVYIVVMILGN